MDTETELLNFWQWVYSDLRSNTIRPMLAEYLVGKALGCLGPFRLEWTPWDFEFEGAKIEVKSAGHVQSWAQKAPSKIIFSIAPAKDAYGIDQISRLGPGRHADVYVFCLHTEKDRKLAGKFDLKTWEFYVVSTNAIEKVMGAQESISLARLRNIASACKWENLRQKVSAALPSN